MVTIRTASSRQAGLTSMSATDARPSYPCGNPSLDETLTFGARICDRGAGGAPGYGLQPRPLSRSSLRAAARGLFLEAHRRRLETRYERLDRLLESTKGSE